jgi:hypothetical protein
MPAELTTYPDFFGAGDKEPIPAGEFDQDTLKAGSPVTLWAKQVGQDQSLFFGHGPADREYAKAFVGLDLVASGAGTGTAGDALQGKVVLAITDSDQRHVLAQTTLDTIAQLRDSLGEKRTSRIIMAAMAPYAKPGRHVEIRVVADPASDGAEVDPTASGGNLYYTRVTN